MPLYGMVSLLALLAGAPHIPYRLQLSFESTVFFTLFKKKYYYYYYV